MALVTCFALIGATAGWYYLLHAGKATHLAAFERPAHNLLRIRLRRWNGAALVVMSVAFYVGFRIAENDGNAISIVVCFGAVLLLLPVVLFLAYVDIRLTRSMRAAQERREKSENNQ